MTSAVPNYQLEKSQMKYDHKDFSRFFSIFKDTEERTIGLKIDESSFHQKISLRIYKLIAFLMLLLFFPSYSFSCTIVGNANTISMSEVQKLPKLPERIFLGTIQSKIRNYAHQNRNDRAPKVFSYANVLDQESGKEIHIPMEWHNENRCPLYSPLNIGDTYVFLQYEARAEISSIIKQSISSPILNSIKNEKIYLALSITTPLLFKLKPN